MTRTTLLDEVLPRCDFRLQHSAIFRVPAGTAFHTALYLDLLRHPLVRALIAARTLPLQGTGPRTLRIADLTEPPLGWSVLTGRPDTELILATLAQPWRVGALLPRSPPVRRSSRLSPHPATSRLFLGCGSCRRARQPRC